MGRKRNACSLLTRKPEGKKPLERPGHGWVHNIKMDLGEIGWGCVVRLWIGRSGESSCEFVDEHSGSIECWETVE
jgi:hypothetical protein